MAAYQRAPKNQQDAMIQNYLDNVLRNNPDFKLAQAAIREQARIVPVALDLGIVLLRHAQTQNDPQARKRELEKAEKTFLAIRNIAGKNDEYRITLGQVYYWMGKHAEGRKLFDEYLADSQRRAGTPSFDRGRLSKANWTPKSGITPHTCAAITNTDQDDRLDWLSKCDPDDRFHQAELAGGRGEKALAENRDEEAGALLRQAIGHYQAIPESPTILNNSALIHLSLYRLTGDAKEPRSRFCKSGEGGKVWAPRDSMFVLHANVADILLNNAAHRRDREQCRGFATSSSGRELRSLRISH